MCQGQDAELLVPGPTGIDRVRCSAFALSVDEAKAFAPSPTGPMAEPTRQWTAGT